MGASIVRHPFFGMLKLKGRNPVDGVMEKLRESRYPCILNILRHWRNRLFFPWRALTVIVIINKQETKETGGKHSLLELQGLGKEIWEKNNTQQYIDEERDSWD